MSDRDIDRLFGEISAMRQDIQRLMSQGCAKAPEHADHEQRLRTLEAVRQRQAGMLAAASGGASIITAILIWVGKIIIASMTNGKQ